MSAAIPDPAQPFSDGRELMDVLGLILGVYVLPAAFAGGAIWLAWKFCKTIIMSDAKYHPEPMRWEPDGTGEQPETDRYDVHVGAHFPHGECRGCRALFGVNPDGELVLGDGIDDREANAWYAGFRAGALLSRSEPDEPVDEVQHTEWPTRDVGFPA